MNVKQIDLTHDMAAILAVWQQCFPDDDDFAEQFLTTAVPPAVGLAVYDEKTPVSMAFFLPSTLHLDGNTFSAGYIYAVATLPAFRGGGYAALLLQEIRKRFTVDLLYLHPATPFLTTLYEKNGYCRFLYTDMLQATPSPVTETISFRQLPLDIHSYRFERQRLFLPAVCYGDFPDTLLQLLPENSSQICFDGGSALLFENSTACLLTDFFGDTARIPALLCAISTRFPQKAVAARMAGLSQATAMVLPITARAKALLTQYPDGVPFGGFLFDF